MARPECTDCGTSSSWTWNIAGAASLANVVLFQHLRVPAASASGVSHVSVDVNLQNDSTLMPVPSCAQRLKVSPDSNYME